MPTRKDSTKVVDAEEAFEPKGVDVAEDAVEVATEQPAETDMFFTVEDQMIREAFSAFVRAQKALGNVAKDSKGNYGKFLSLPKLLEAVRTALNDNDLFVTQSTLINGGDYVVITEIRHVNGLVVAESEYPIQTADKTNPQKMGSGLTYARRYALMSLVGVGAEDDEGELAKQPAAPRKLEAKPQVLRKLTERGVKTAAEFEKLAKEAGISAKSSQELTEEQAAIWLPKLSENGAATPF